MEEKSSLPTSRPVSPSASSKSNPRQQRRASVPNTTGRTERIDPTRRASSQIQQGNQTNNPLPQSKNPVPPRPAHQLLSGQRSGTKSSWRKLRPQANAAEGEEAPDRDLKITLHDILQSRWIENLNHHAPEQIYLTVDNAPLSQMSTIDTNFCWVHHERDPEKMFFDDFVRIVNNTPLYQHEYDVALQALSEVERMRHVYAKGKYFEPLVYEVKNGTESIAGKKAEVKATFISVPIFSSMQSKDPHPDYKPDDHYGRFSKPLQILFEKMHELVHEEAYSRDHHKDLATEILRNREGHPIRSLMQCKNILAVDNSRDWQQAMIRLGDRKGSHQPFLHVPELWVLIINMYTIVTCGPFSVEQLEGKNIKQFPPEEADERVNIKYTNLHGALHEFRCRTWLGLLNTITSIEHHVDDEEELSEQLCREDSSYKLVDANFRLIDRRRWIWLTRSGRATSKLYVRLLKTELSDAMNVAFSTRKCAISRRLAWEHMRHQVVWERLRLRLKDLRRKGVALKEIRPVEEKLSTISLKIDNTKTERIRQRFFYAAVRYHLIDPEGLLFHEDQTYLDAVRERVNTAKPESSLSAIEANPDQLRANESRRPSLTPLSRSRTGSPVPKRKLAVPVAITGSSNPEIPSKSSNLNVPTSEDPVIKLQIIDRFKPPPTRKLQDLPELDTFQTQPGFVERLVNGGTVEDHQRPRKALTSISLTASQTTTKKLLPPPRARTYGGQDIEAQFALTEPQVTVTSETPEETRAPTYVIREQANGPVGKGIPKSIPAYRTNQVKANPIPYSLQSSTQTRPFRTAPVAIAPPRLPRLSGDTKPLDGNAVGSGSSGGHTRQTHLGVPRVYLSEPNHRPTDSNLTPDRSPESTDKSLQSRIKAVRKKKDLLQLQPYFKWTTSGMTTPTSPRESHRDQSFALYETAGIGGLSYRTESIDTDDPSTDPARRILRILFHQMTTASYFVSKQFEVKPQDFVNVVQMSSEEVAALLDDQHTGLTRHTTDQKSAEFKWETRAEIVLSVDSILRCFVGNDNQDEMMIRKIWGLVGGIVSVPLEELKMIDANCVDFKPSVLTWLKNELAQMEQTCSEILISARSDTGNKDEQLNISLPQAFFAQFRAIILFLLATNLLRQNPEAYYNPVKEMLKTVEEGWLECDSALVRAARSFKEHGDKQDYLHESIKTADTLLGLLLYNAFALSTSPMNMEDHSLPHCDLEHIYRRWTFVCHERAIREASAEMYEEVRLLREELHMVIKILKDQKLILEQINLVRESPYQTLDERVNKRTETFLDDTINHFETLEAYAKEAEALTTNSIRVRSEGNSKAIFVFTFVTVIFLPLNSISSILGMNTVDIRGTSRTSSFFWEISIPVMFSVLLICLLLMRLKFKFGLRSKIGRCVLMVFPGGWESEHMRNRRERGKLSALNEQPLRPL